MPDNDIHVLNKIGRHVFLVALHISWPKMRHRIADAIVEVQEGGHAVKLDEGMHSNPQWKLMPNEWWSRLTSIESRARRLLAGASISFGTKGVSALPISRATEVFNGLRQQRAMLLKCRDEFVAAYADILGDLRLQLGDQLFRAATGKLPSHGDVMRRFSMTWPIIPIGPQRVNTNLITTMIGVLHAYAPPKQQDVQWVLAELAELMKGQDIELADEGRAADLVAEARKHMEEHAVNIVEAMFKEPRQAIVEAIDHIVTSMQAGKDIRSGSIAQLERAFMQLKGFEFLADSELQSRIKETQQFITGISTAQLHRDEVACQQLADELRKVKDAALNQEVQQPVIRKFLRLNVSKPIHEAQQQAHNAKQMP